MTELPEPDGYATESAYKKAVYDEIHSGIPTWIMDMKLSINYRKTHDMELSESMKKLNEALNDES